MYALRQLRELECAYAPALLTFAGTVVCNGVYEDALVGGYSFFILMTKLPGQVLDLGQYCKLSPAERDEIRTAFREALTDVWDCGIVPQDTAARNIMWDAAEKKNDCTLLDPNTETPPDFQEGVYDDWELSEEVVSLYRRRSGWDKTVQQT
ncbi:hypothetical protein N0V87_005705 [Didymella glomerata]|uniref:Uncharacterized protein n=1 Tax=Didymella glomerata TaxID=749621 RepID=A0A9W8WY02_9PLEO|nr:hypothetical protein N0V87_005705 [Didymella glomerata]